MNVSATRRSAVLLAALASSWFHAGPVADRASAAVPRLGPPNGSLVLTGGGETQASGIPSTFIRLAGGPRQLLVVIPTNRARPPTEAATPFNEAAILGRWPVHGFKRVVILHTFDRRVANSRSFVRPLLTANAVWLDGGRPWKSVDAYRGTRTERAIRGVLRRGGVVGGTSGGSTLAGDLLMRGGVLGPSELIPSEPGHRHGLAFLHGVAIDTHADVRKRWYDMIPVVTAFPRYLGLGIGENTAIVVQGDRMRVIGRGRVAVTDATRHGTPWGIGFDLLKPGDRYNLATRTVLRRNWTARAPGAYVPPTPAP